MENQKEVSHSTINNRNKTYIICCNTCTIICRKRSYLNQV